MALPTALAMLALSAGLLAANTGLAVLARGRGPGGALLRRLAPAAVIVPVALTFVTLEGLRSDWFDEREGLALLGAALIVVLALLADLHRGAARADPPARAGDHRRHRRRRHHARRRGPRARVQRGRRAHVRPPPRRRDRQGAGAARDPRGAPRAAHRRGLARAVARGESTIVGRPVELTAMRADGSEFPAEVTISRLERRRPGACSSATSATSPSGSRASAPRATWPRSWSPRATRSSPSAWTGRSRAGTRPRSGSTATRARRRSAATSRSWSSRPERRAEMPEVGAELMSGRSINDESIHMRRDGGRFPGRGHDLADPRRRRARSPASR